MRQQELQDEEERIQKRQELSTSSTSVAPGEVKDNPAVPSSRSIEGKGNVSFPVSSRMMKQPSHRRTNGDDDYDLNLEDITVMEAIWHAIQDNEKKPLVESSEAGISHHINIREDNSIGDHQLDGRRNTGWSSRKVNLEMIFVITNFVLELPSTVFDQLSSVHKPQYALLSMLISIAAILICIIELVYKVRREKVTWKWRSTLPWIYYPSTHKRFGNFKDIIGLVCALCQCIVTSITFDFVRRHADNPIKVSVWPIIFAFGLLCSKILEKPESS